MQMTNNTILITGGGSGIGRALAEAFHGLGNQVIIAGRRPTALEETVAANPGMRFATVDLADPGKIDAFASEMASNYPRLNVVINNAGIMKPENILSAPKTADSDLMIQTNLIGPIHLTSALLPLLERQPGATVMTVSSGLAFLPLAFTPTYCATKAAIHSYSQSLRFQLKDTNVKVIELVPPYVATELMGAHQATDPHAMPLGDFIAEVMDILTTQPDATEVCVKRVYPLRYAAEQGQAKYVAFFENFNQSMSAAAAAGAQ